MPPFDVLPLFSAGRSRKLTLVPIIQSLAQLEKNYGKEGCEIIQDNAQDTIFGGFAPNSQTAEVLSKALGSRTVLSGSVSRGKNDPSQSFQMIERALMTADELKAIPKGNFVLMKTGMHPMRTRLRLFLEWGITFAEPYTVPEREDKRIVYACREDLQKAITKQYPPPTRELPPPPRKSDSSGLKSEMTQNQEPVKEVEVKPVDIVSEVEQQLILTQEPDERASSKRSAYNMRMLGGDGK